MDLDRWLARRFGGDVAARTPVVGGCIHRAWRVERTHGAPLFVKTQAAAALPLLVAEAEGLAALAAAAPPELCIPAPLGHGLAGDQAVLVLPWLALQAPPTGASGWRQLGVSLARLHRQSLEQPCAPCDRSDGTAGWPSDNWIGATPQINGWCSNWADFFRDRRLAPQLARLARRDGPLAGGDALLERSTQWLGGHDPQACLVHGDLWSGNAGHLADGRAAVFDPAVYRGDREVDLAMAHLFGGFPESFFRGYEESWPLPPGSRDRRPLYNLYHILNHANLFGGAYRSQAESLINRLLSDQPR